MSFEAKYVGTCSKDCGVSIKPGDMIVFAGSGEYSHVSCPDDLDDRASKFEGTTLEEMGY